MKYLIITTVLLFSLPIFSQTDFEWDVVFDVPNLSQDEIYSRTKLFIGKSWKSSIDIIQSDDREVGQVLVKVKMIERFSHYRYSFTYNIIFQMKDQRARILISDVECIYARSYNDLWIIPPVLDQYPQTNAKQLTGLNETRYLTLMVMLKLDLQQIIKNYKVEVLEYSPDW